MLIWVRMMIDLAAIQGSPAGYLCGPVSARMEWDLASHGHDNCAWALFWEVEVEETGIPISRKC